MSRWFWLLGVAVLCCAPAGAVLSAGGGKDGPRGKSEFTLSREEQELMDLVNAERKKHDLAPLRPNPTLFRVAREHSANMARQGKMAHVLDGKNPYERVKASGYKYRFAGENVGRGDVPLAEVVQGWMDSKVHRDNILRKEFTETGLGAVSDGKELVYYTQVFATPQKAK
jgi:uncharacterized protein YkwD